jgi:hypothetical protein
MSMQRRWPFNASMVMDAPDYSGVYALWRDGELIHLGEAEGGRDTIRARLLSHLHATSEGQARPTHYSWEISRDPTRRREQLLADLGDDQRGS